MRVKKLKRNLARSDRLPYFISNLTNVKYLTGFKGSYASLVVDENRTFFITDSRYEEYAGSILPDSVELVIQRDGLIESLKDVLESLNKKILNFESLLDLSSYNSIKDELKGIRLIPCEDEVSSLRAVKDDEELADIKKAVEITDNCFNHLLKIAKPGILEWDLSIEIEYFYRKNGCRKSAFDSVVASGTGSSMPHYMTSMTKKIEKGDILLIDMGCVFNGYNSDLTRTVFMDNITPEFETIYNIVKRAQESAISSVKPGITAGGLDKTARQVIVKEDYGWAFGHALGHGVGLDIHEMPALKKGNKFRLKKNIVFTVEPGIYIPNSGGVRIEDVVRVTEDGYEVLTKSTKEMIIIA